MDYEELLEDIKLKQGDSSHTYLFSSKDVGIFGDDWQASFNIVNQDDVEVIRRNLPKNIGVTGEPDNKYFVFNIYPEESTILDEGTYTLTIEVNNTCKKYNREIISVKLKILEQKNRTTYVVPNFVPDGSFIPNPFGGTGFVNVIDIDESYISVLESKQVTTIAEPGLNTVYGITNAITNDGLSMVTSKTNDNTGSVIITYDRPTTSDTWVERNRITAVDILNDTNYVTVDSYFNASGLSNDGLSLVVMLFGLSHVPSGDTIHKVITLTRSTRNDTWAKISEFDVSLLEFGGVDISSDGLNMVLVFNNSNNDYSDSRISTFNRNTPQDEWVFVTQTDNIVGDGDDGGLRIKLSNDGLYLVYGDSFNDVPGVISFTRPTTSSDWVKDETFNYPGLDANPLYYGGGFGLSPDGKTMIIGNLLGIGDIYELHKFYRDDISSSWVYKGLEITETIVGGYGAGGYGNLDITDEARTIVVALPNSELPEDLSGDVTGGYGEIRTFDSYGINGSPLTGLNYDTIPISTPDGTINSYVEAEAGSGC